MTSSTPEPLVVRAAGRVLSAGHEAVVDGRGPLVVRVGGAQRGAQIVVRLGERERVLWADDDGQAELIEHDLLDLIAGELVVTSGAHRVVLRVRPEKLTDELLHALVDELEATAEGLAHAAGGATTLAGRRTRDADLRRLEEAVGLAASAAPAIRRRPIHRARETVRAVPRQQGARSSADIRWLATHPIAAARAATGGHAIGVQRERRADLDTLENRGVLSAHDRLGQAVRDLIDVVDAEIGALHALQAQREAFLTQRGNLWTERDLPRLRALERRREHLEALHGEATALRARAALPDLRPRGRDMVRTPRVDAEPAYWATYRAAQVVRRLADPVIEPPPAPLRSLDVLWEQWCTVAVLRQLDRVLGTSDGGTWCDVGWFSDLRRGTLGTWTQAERVVTLRYEPEIGPVGRARKIVPGRPWTPDIVIDVAWADGTLDLHVLDAKMRRERGAAPWSAFHEIWTKYGDTIGDAAGWPVVRSVWALWPGQGCQTTGPRMLDAAWPIERLRGGCVGVLPGDVTSLTTVVDSILGR